MRSQSLLLALRGASSLTASTSSSTSCSSVAAALSGFRRYHKNVRESLCVRENGRIASVVCSRFFLLFMPSIMPASRALPALSFAFESTGAHSAVFFKRSSNERGQKEPYRRETSAR